MDLVAPDGSVYTLLNRSGGSADNVDQTFTVDLSSIPANGNVAARVRDAAAAEAIRPHRDHRVLHAHVAVDRDVLHVHHGGAADDHVVHHPRAAPAAPPRSSHEAPAAPPRQARLAPAEGHPAHKRRPDAHPHAGRAEEGHQRRRVDRPHDHRARRPRPDAVHVHPAPVVIRRPAPGRGVDPGPAEARIPDPAAGGVGGPVRGHAVRHPDRAVLGHHAPRAVLIEIVHARDVRRDVARAHGVDERVGARVVPAVPHVQLGGHEALHLRRLTAGHHRLLAGGDRDRLAAGRDHGRHSAAPGDERGPIGRHVDAVVAGVGNGERGGRRVDLHGAARLERAQIQGDVSRRDLQLEEVGLVILDAELAVAPRADEAARLDLDLEVAAIAGVELIAGSERRVHLGGRPVLAAGPPERHVPGDVAEPRRRGRRAVRLVGRDLIVVVGIRGGRGRGGGRGRLRRVRGGSRRGARRWRGHGGRALRPRAGRGTEEQQERQQGRDGPPRDHHRWASVGDRASISEAPRAGAPEATGPGVPSRTCTACRRCRNGAAPPTPAHP